MVTYCLIVSDSYVMQQICQVFCADCVLCAKAVVKHDYVCNKHFITSQIAC